MTCGRCHGLLRADEDGVQVCVMCARPHNPPPVGPVDKAKWPGGVQPAPVAPKPRSGDHNATPPLPLPSHPWREASGAHWAATEAAQVTLAALRRRRKAMAEASKARSEAQVAHTVAMRRQMVGRKVTGKQRVAPVGGIGV